MKSLAGRGSLAGGAQPLAMAFLALACAAVAISSRARADGLPIDSDSQHPSSTYTVITLTPEQDREVQRERLFTPTPEQLVMLRTIDPTCPRRLQVVTPWYNDCGCGMHGYVLWFRPGEVDVPHDAIGRWPRYEGQLILSDAAAGDTTAIALMAGRGAQTEEAEAYIAGHASGSLVMDLDGHLYYNGSAVDIEAILAIVDRQAAAAVADSSARAGAARDGLDADREDPACLWLHMPPMEPRPGHTWLFNRLFLLAWKLASRGYRLILTG